MQNAFLKNLVRIQKKYHKVYNITFYNGMQNVELHCINKKTNYSK